MWPASLARPSLPDTVRSRAGASRAGQQQAGIFAETPALTNGWNPRYRITAGRLSPQPPGGEGVWPSLPIAVPIAGASPAAMSWNAPASLQGSSLGSPHRVERETSRRIVVPGRRFNLLSHEGYSRLLPSEGLQILVCFAGLDVARAAFRRGEADAQRIALQLIEPQP